MGRVKTKVSKNHKKTPKLKRFYCTICKVFVKEYADFDETVVSHHETIIKWTEQCCAVICKVFQLESINDCYRLVLQKGKFCGSCIELMREVELSVREVAKLESKMMKTIMSLKCQFKKGLQKYNLTQDSINETMKQMENFENETELWDWYTSRRGNTCRDPFFPAICLSKIEKNRIRCDEENFQDRQNYFNNANFVDLFSYKALHISEPETAFNFDEESLSRDFGDYYSTFEPEETDKITNLQHTVAPSYDNEIYDAQQTSPAATIIKFEANEPIVEEIVSESVDNLDLHHQPMQTQDQEINKTPEEEKKSEGKTKKRKRNTNKPRKKWVKRLPNRLSCPHCRTTFVKKQYLLENHIRSAHLGEPDGFHCPEEGCDKRYSSSARLCVHIAQYHKGNNGPTVCDKCGDVFQTQHFLKSHKLKTDCGREEDPFKCVLCFFRLTDDASFKEHMDKHKSFATVSPFRCVFCPQICLHMTALKKHTSAQHVPNSLKCSFCNRVFRYVYNCKKHENEHINNKAYKCSVCGKTTASDRDLKKHMEIHSENRKRLQCTQCSASYFRKTHLKAHMIREHSTNAPIYNCQLCDKSYRNKNHLHRHVQRHSGIQHTCKHCNKSFKCTSYLAQHLRGHCPAQKPGASHKSDKSKSSRQEQLNEFANPQQLTKVTQVFPQSGPSVQMNHYDTQQVFVPTNSIMPVQSVGLASFPCPSNYNLNTQYSHNQLYTN